MGFGHFHWRSWFGFPLIFNHGWIATFRGGSRSTEKTVESEQEDHLISLSCSSLPKSQRKQRAGLGRSGISISWIWAHPVISQKSILGFFLRCGQLFCHLIVGPNRVILHFEPESVNFEDFKCQFMAFGSGFEHFQVQKTLQRGSYTPKNKIK
jgi:hypothetical protein